MNRTDVLRGRVAAMTSEELAGALAADPGRHRFSDLEEYREQFVRVAMRQAVAASVWGLVWILYFNRSKRVRATYYADEHAPAAEAGAARQPAA